MMEIQFFKRSYLGNLLTLIMTHEEHNAYSTYIHLVGAEIFCIQSLEDLHIDYCRHANYLVSMLKYVSILTGVTSMQRFQMTYWYDP